MIRLLNESRKANYMNLDAGNDDIAILNPLLSLLCVGKYENTGVKVVWDLPIYATAQNSTQAIVITCESVECGEHDFSSENITPSATLCMNLTETPG